MATIIIFLEVKYLIKFLTQTRWIPEPVEMIFFFFKQKSFINPFTIKIYDKKLCLVYDKKLCLENHIFTKSVLD